jgi:hypothetical protein
MEEFYTRNKANEGVILPLTFPNGEASDHWLRVRGVDSDQFRQAESDSNRKAVELALIEDKEERDKEVRTVELFCIASLVADWSFDKECIDENVVDFLREAPQISDAVNRFAARRSEFFRKKSNSSADGVKQK